MHSLKNPGKGKRIQDYLADSELAVLKMDSLKFLYWAKYTAVCDASKSLLGPSEPEPEEGRKSFLSSSSVLLLCSRLPSWV